MARFMNVIVKPKNRNIIRRDELNITDVSNKSIKIGIVVGTYGTVPYVHLQLESHKRFHPNIPLLVHDDCSNNKNELMKLCNKYNVHFMSNDHRYGHQGGDWTVFVDGIKWADNMNIDVLIKISRRLLLIDNITDDLLKLIELKPSHTYAYERILRSSGWIQTSLIALTVKNWINNLHKRKGHSVERNMYKAILNFNIPKTDWISVDVFNKKFIWRSSRKERKRGHNNIDLYTHFANLWGLNYKEDDFICNI